MRKNANRLTVLAALVIAGGLGAVVLLGSPDAARACGGLFCNSRPPDPFAPLPVAQTGENVVFAIDKDPAGGAPTLVAHIQILYAGDAAKFSWVVPVDAAPTLGVGTDRLFSTLASATQPRFTTQSLIDGQCLPALRSGTAFDGTASPTMGGSDAGVPPPNVTSGGAGVTVSFQGAVGPFDAAVIQSADPMALRMWLTENGYVVSEQAVGLIDGYVREGKYFVALKLLNGVGVRAIQPIVLTFKGIEPCVPLRLTAIAANPDMQVRMWVLGDRRAVPKNVYEMKIDDARIDWISGGSNYNALVMQAANEAGGNAFVTEYAGPSSIAARSLWFDGQYDLTILRAAMTPPVYVQELIRLGLSNDPQTLTLLAKHIPMPDAVRTMGITESQFYGNLPLYWSQYAFPPFDLATLTTDISVKVIEPRHTAQMMIDRHPYLTRLNTFISPEEMDKDPLFIVNRDLPEIPVVRTAIFRTMCGNMQFMACNAPIRAEFPDGRMAWVRTGSTAATCTGQPYDFSKLKGLPAADVVWQREETGEGTRAIDNASVIQAGLLQNNNAFPAEQKMFPIPAQTPVTNRPVTTDPNNPNPIPQGAGMGCACGVGGPAAGGIGAGAFALVGVVAIGRRRRRRNGNETQQS